MLMVLSLWHSHSESSPSSSDKCRTVPGGYRPLNQANQFGTLGRLMLYSHCLHACTYTHVQVHSCIATRNAFCGMLDGLALLPVVDVVAGLAWLRNEMPADAVPLVNYFDETYVTGSSCQVTVSGLTRKPVTLPWFPPETWSIHERHHVGWWSPHQRVQGLEQPSSSSRRSPPPDCLVAGRGAAD